MNALNRVTSTIATLRTVAVHKNLQTIYVSGVDAIFKFSASNSSDDDGSTVIKPANVSSTKPGRWLLSLIGAAGHDLSARAYTSDVQSIPGGDVDTKVALDVSDYDTDSMWDPDNNQFVVQTAGKYLIVAGGALAGSGAAIPDFELGIGINDEMASASNSHKHDADHQPLSTHWLGELAEGDTVSLIAAQDTAVGHGAINLEAGAWLAIQKVDKAG